MLHLLYPFLCHWTFKLLPYLACWKQCFSEHWGTCILFDHVLSRYTPRSGIAPYACSSKRSFSEKSENFQGIKLFWAYRPWWQLLSGARRRISRKEEGDREPIDASSSKNNERKQQRTTSSHITIRQQEVRWSPPVIQMMTVGTLPGTNRFSGNALRWRFRKWHLLWWW